MSNKVVVRPSPPVVLARILHMLFIYCQTKLVLRSAAPQQRLRSPTLRCNSQWSTKHSLVTNNDPRRLNHKIQNFGISLFGSLFFSAKPRLLIKAITSAEQSIHK